MPIASVSETLESVLTEAFSTLSSQQPPEAELDDLQGPMSTTPARMTVFLFNVIEDAAVRNQRPPVGVTPQGLTMARGPAPLILRYLLTPWSGEPETDHLLIARAIQALHDEAILSGPQLKGELAGTDAAIKLKMAPLSLEEQTRVWHAVQKPYRLSVTYDARVIRLQSEKVVTRPPVRSRTIDFETGTVVTGDN